MAMRSKFDFPIVYSCYVHGYDFVGFRCEVDWHNLRQSKAKFVFALFHELNDAIDTKLVEELLEFMLEFNLAFFSQFVLVITT
jgi:hypothetical protein